MRNQDMPSMNELGVDLLSTNMWQRWQPVPMPFLYAIGFMVAWHWSVYWLSFVFLVLVFSACSTSTHDVVHRSLGLSPRATEWMLFLMGFPLFESGHSYRSTHLYHHKRFPHDDDLEGEAAHLPMWKVFVSGPTFMARLWLWSWRENANRPIERLWLILEGGLAPGSLMIGWLFMPWTSAVFAYAVTVLASTFLYPLFAIHLPHRHFEEGVRWTEAWTCRGRWIPKLFLPLAYHLEHHLYPQVPSHNLPELARRLQPWLVRAGVEPIRVP
ncbi:MAG: fatty acid desaturase family protein [Fimbriimonadaceae bacterium]